MWKAANFISIFIFQCQNSMKIWEERKKGKKEGTRKGKGRQKKGRGREKEGTKRRKRERNKNRRRKKRRRYGSKVCIKLMIIWYT